MGIINAIDRRPEWLITATFFVPLAAGFTCGNAVATATAGMAAFSVAIIAVTAMAALVAIAVYHPERPSPLRNKVFAAAFVAATVFLFLVAFSLAIQGSHLPVPAPPGIERQYEEPSAQRALFFFKGLLYHFRSTTARELMRIRGATRPVIRPDARSDDLASGHSTGRQVG